tara:strand:- start:2285 stop:2692 length:408 start_codon:yes stop_codon:yes gene_type:complete
VVFVPKVAVGVVGVPVRAGDAKGAKGAMLANTKAVLETCVVSVPKVAVGVVGVPVRAGDANGARTTRSSTTAPTNTTALPVRLRAESELLLSVTVRDRVVPEAVYVPVPISQSGPSSITYRTTLVSTTPASANVW